VLRTRRTDFRKGGGLLAVLKASRILVAWLSVGVCMSANYLTLHCLQERRQFGTTLFAFALSQEKFVRMAVSVTVIHMSHVFFFLH
jgi:alkylation response protein AidB-like acyl-CoA dehydrogenase